jgi:predicted N-acetyltransferase YhbS
VTIDYLTDEIVTIRRIAGWLHAEFGHRGRGSNLQTRIERIRRRAKRRDIPLTFVAREKGVVVGTASLVAHDMETRLDLTPWLASVYVLPNYRRRGFGSSLCKRVVQEAHRLGFGRLYLFTFDRKTFYERLGWKAVQRGHYHTHEVTVMVLGIKCA